MHQFGEGREVEQPHRPFQRMDKAEDVIDGGVVARLFFQHQQARCRALQKVAGFADEE